MSKARPSMFKHVFVDGDVLAYRSAFSAKDKPERMLYRKIDDLMEYILDKTVVFTNEDDYTVCLTGSNNFRKDVGVTHVYKGNRLDGNRPDYLPLAREYLEDRYSANVADGEEADDVMAKGLTLNPEAHVIASIDKDMLQVPGWHFEFAKNVWHYSTEEFGTRFFYKQILTGDNVDNIVGLWRVGPAKAEKILGDTKDEIELYNKVLDAYDGDADRVLENARLLWLRRYDGQMWTPPTERDEDES